MYDTPNSEAIKNEEVVPVNKTEQLKRSWRRPQIERLHLSLDTAFTGGSNDEGAGRSTIL